jgi:hypothetical protein
VLVHESASKTIFAQLQTDPTSEQQVASIITPVGLKVRVNPPLISGAKLQYWLELNVVVVEVVQRDRHKSIFTDCFLDPYDIGHIWNNPKSELQSDAPGFMMDIMVGGCSACNHSRCE